MVIYMVCYFMDYCIMTYLILKHISFFYFIFIRDYIINLIMNKYYYFIIIIVIIIIGIILKRNINEKFQEAECQSDIIVTELCTKICEFTSPDPDCVDKCRPFAKRFFIDNPNNIWGYFLLKHIRSAELLQKRSMLENARDFLVVQTELAAKLTTLYTQYDSSSENELLLGNIWKRYNQDDLDETKNIEEISDLTVEQINIINNLKATLETVGTEKVNFNTETVPTLLEIKSIIPTGEELTLPDRYSYWISIDKEGETFYYKPYNFRCNDRINEVLTHNDFIKFNNKILGQLWELYISTPDGDEIIYSGPLTLFEDKINNIDGKKWLEFSRTGMDMNMYVKLNDDSSFTIWLKLLISIKNSITNNGKTYYDFTHNEFHIIQSLKADSGYSQLSIYHYVIINEGTDDEKCYRPFDDIYFATNFDGLTQISSHNSYISHNYNGENIYFKIIPPLIVNSTINQMCSDNNYVKIGELEDEYFNYDMSTIKSKISNKITLAEIAEESTQNNLNSKEDILRHLNTRSTPIEDNDLQYYELNDVIIWYENLKRTHEAQKTAEIERRNDIESNCEYTLDDVKTWNSLKNININGTDYGNVKPANNGDDGFYIANSEIQRLKTDTGDITSQCLLTKTEAGNDSLQKININGTDYGNVKPVDNGDDGFYIANSDTISEINNINSSCLLNKDQLSSEPANFSFQIDTSQVNYGKIKTSDGDGNYVEIGAQADEYINSQCYITNNDQNKWGKIKKEGGDGKYVLVDDTYGELGIDDGKYGRTTDFVGTYGLINTSAAASPSDYIPISQCNKEYKKVRNEDIIETNDNIAELTTLLDAQQRSIMEGSVTLASNWDKIKNHYCINDKLESQYNTCISDHLQDGSPVLSYSEFKDTDEYTSVKNSNQTNGDSDSITDWTGKYISGPGEGMNCKPRMGETAYMYIEGGTCEVIGNECIDREKIISKEILTTKKEEIKANKATEVTAIGFKENIANYANKYINTDTQCTPAGYVPSNWQPSNNSCTISNQMCDYSECPNGLCPVDESCILKTHTATENEIDFENGLNDDNTYYRSYNSAKSNWGGKYSTGGVDEDYADAKECVTRDSVPSNYKAQDSDEVCGGNLACADVANHVRAINEASDDANNAACTLLSRKSCAEMKRNLDNCAGGDLLCPSGQKINIATCSKEDGTGTCINCPPCSPGKTRNNANGNWENATHNYCGECVDCGECTDPDKWLDGCTGEYPFPEGTCRDCGVCPNSPTDPLTYKTGCDLIGDPICRPNVQNTNNANVYRTYSSGSGPQGVLVPAQTCPGGQYLSGFVKATDYIDGEAGVCLDCTSCDEDTHYNSGCFGFDGPGVCIPKICGSCAADSGKKKNGCSNTFSTDSDGNRNYDANCENCPVGTKQTRVDEVNQCTPCGVGEYQDVTGETTCKSCTTVCQFGIQTDNCSGTGSTINNLCYTPVTCPAGQYLQVSASVGQVPVCSNCPANTYQPNGDNSDGIDSCISCGDGTTATILSSDAGSSCCEYKRCNAADEYVQATLTGGICSKFSSVDCGICSSGERKIGCKLFPDLPSSTQSDIVVNCEACPSNFVSSGTNAECIECNEGQVAVGGVCVNHTCGQGQFVGMSGGQANCQQCPANTYREERNHSFTTCSPCPNKENSPLGSGSCTMIAPCPKNHYINVREPGTYDDVTCELCGNDENTAVDNQLTSCNKIFCGTNQKLNKRPAGNDGSIDVSCTSCPVDKYINQENHQRTECWRACICDGGTPIISQDCEDFYNKNLGTGGEYYRGGQGGNRQLTACDSCSGGGGESYQTCLDNDLSPVNMNRKDIHWGSSSPGYNDPWGVRSSTCPCPAGGCSDGRPFMQGNLYSPEYNQCGTTSSQPSCSAIKTYKKCSN